jgi:hypothetical protein
MSDLAKSQEGSKNILRTALKKEGVRLRVA